MVCLVALVCSGYILPWFYLYFKSRGKKGPRPVKNCRPVFPEHPHWFRYYQAKRDWARSVKENKKKYYHYQPTMQTCNFTHQKNNMVVFPLEQDGYETTIIHSKNCMHNATRLPYNRIIIKHNRKKLKQKPAENYNRIILTPKREKYYDSEYNMYEEILNDSNDSNDNHNHNNNHNNNNNMQTNCNALPTKRESCYFFYPSDCPTEYNSSDQTEEYEQLPNPFVGCNNNDSSDTDTFYISYFDPSEEAVNLQQACVSTPNEEGWNPRTLIKFDNARNIIAFTLNHWRHWFHPSYIYYAFLTKDRKIKPIDFWAQYFGVVENPYFSEDDNNNNDINRKYNPKITQTGSWGQILRKQFYYNHNIPSKELEDGYSADSE